MWWSPRDWSQTDWGLKPLPAASWVCNFGQTSVRNRCTTVVTCQSCGHSDAGRGRSPPSPPAPSTPNPFMEKLTCLCPLISFSLWSNLNRVNSPFSVYTFVSLDRCTSYMTTRTRQNISISPQILTYSCTAAPTPTPTPPLLCFLFLSFFLFRNVT